jgi:hypothetical protein
VQRGPISDSLNLILHSLLPMQVCPAPTHPQSSLRISVRLLNEDVLHFFLEQGAGLRALHEECRREFGLPLDLQQLVVEGASMNVCLC